MFSLLDLNKKELLKECGYWGVHTNISRVEASKTISKVKWIALLFLKLIAIFILRPKQWNQKVRCKDKDVLAIYFTINQKKAIESCFNDFKNFHTISNGLESDYQMPWGRFAWLCIKKMPAVTWVLFNCKSSSLYIPWIEEFVRYEAGKIFAQEIFKRFHPLAILISNDHSGVSRAVNRVAKELGIKCIYTQHASIGNSFPELNFDLSLLDGIQALDQYLNSGNISGLVVITGRFKKNLNPKSEKIKKNYIGIATNHEDDLKYWDKILNVINLTGNKIILRYHPGDRRKNSWIKLAGKYKAEISQGEISKFFASIDLLVAGVTGAILDANIAEVPSIMLAPEKLRKDLMKDYYGYERYGICKNCEDIDNLKELINELLNVKQSFDNVIYFEAGLVSDPRYNKDKILSAYIDGIKSNKNFSPDPADYSIFSYRNIEVYADNFYIKSLVDLNF